MRWAKSGVGEIIVGHFQTVGLGNGLATTAAPVIVALASTRVELATDLPGVLLAVVGVLTGFLFQVLAWIGGRVGELSDSGQPASNDLLTRLRCSRANVSYATLVSLLLVVVLIIDTALSAPPVAVRYVAIGLLTHLLITLVLVLTRVNAIGIDDEVSNEKNARSHLRTVGDGEIRRRKQG